jgi:hypothetical protein
LSNGVTSKPRAFDGQIYIALFRGKSAHLMNGGFVLRLKAKISSVRKNPTFSHV